MHKTSYDVAPGDARAAAYADALAHPLRLMIYRILKERGPLPMLKLAELLPVAAPTVIQHLKPMREAGLLTYTKTQFNAFYGIDRDAVEEMKRIFSEL